MSATRPWHPPALAAAIAVLVYAPSIAGGFLYDDIAILVDNRRIQDLANLGAVLRYEPARPLLGLTWALNYAAAGPGGCCSRTARSRITGSAAWPRHCGTPREGWWRCPARPRSSP